MKKLIFISFAFIGLCASMLSTASCGDSAREAFLRDSLLKDSLLKDSLLKDSLQKDSILKDSLEKVRLDSIAQAKALQDKKADMLIRNIFSWMVSEGAGLEEIGIAHCISPKVKNSRLLYLSAANTNFPSDNARILSITPAEDDWYVVKINDCGSTVTRRFKVVMRGNTAYAEDVQ